MPIGPADREPLQWGWRPVSTCLVRPIRGGDKGGMSSIDQPNALSRAFGVLGDEWTLLLLGDALSGTRRYSEFNADLPISHAVLTSRLDLLVEESLMERHIYQTHPVRSEYALTPKGRAVWPILVAIWNWERTWVPDHAYSTPAMRHVLCGHEFSPRYCCRACDAQVKAQDLQAQWASGGWRRSVPETRTRRRSPSRRRAQQSFYPDTMTVFGKPMVVGAGGCRLHGDQPFHRFPGSPGSASDPARRASRAAV